MKKKLISTLALSLCFVMSMGTLAGCKDDGDSSGGGKPLTQDQIAQKVFEAIENTKAYTGAFTLTENSSETEKSFRPGDDAEEVVSGAVAMMVTIDPVANKCMMTQSRTQTDGTESRVRAQTQKLFKEGDKYYQYMKGTDSMYPDNDSEQYIEASALMASVAMSSYTLKTYGFDEMLPQGVTSLAAHNADWASYIADSKAEIVAGSTDEESEWYEYSAPEASYVVSAAEVNGAYTLTVKMSSSLTDYDDETYTLNREYTYTAKDGKLVSMLVKQEYNDVWYEADDGTGNWDYVPKGTAGALEVYDKETEETLVTLSYAFTQATYDSITTTLPANVQVMPDIIQKEMTVFVNGVKYENAEAYGFTVADALSDAWSDSGADVVWYKDEACTQAIDADAMTMEEFYALDTLYARATAKAGYVLYTQETVDAFAADVPAAYKTALVEYAGSYTRVNTCYANEGIRVWTSEDDEFFVNGTKVDRSTLDMFYPVVEGQTYEVKEVYTHTKADLNFFNMLGE